VKENRSRLGQAPALIRVLVGILILSGLSPAENSQLPSLSPQPNSVPTPRLLTSRRKIPARCNDKLDNDRDGLIDYPKDPECRNRRDNSERASTSTTYVTPTPPPALAKVPPELGSNASLQGRRPFPDDNAWNQDISGEPVDPNSETLIASMGADTNLHPDFGTVWEGAPIGIPYVVVSSDQAKSTVLFNYTDESDPGPYPIPANPPIEGGEQSQGDRHVIILDRDNWLLYELYNFQQMGTRYQAGSGAIFDLNSNSLRPEGWTSADAAGLPIFPGLVRYDEAVEKGSIEHALRFTVQRTQRAYVSPARHYASTNTSPNLPPMGCRVRLKSSFDHTSFPAPVQVILIALKKYGMILADNGSNWFISGAPDSRWNDDQLATLRQVKGKDFEVIKMGPLTTK
jgi:hypothetical protein